MNAGDTVKPKSKNTSVQSQHSYSTVTAQCSNSHSTVTAQCSTVTVTAPSVAAPSVTPYLGAVDVALDAAAGGRDKPDVLAIGRNGRANTGCCTDEHAINMGTKTAGRTGCQGRLGGGGWWVGGRWWWWWWVAENVHVGGETAKIKPKPKHGHEEHRARRVRGGIREDERFPKPKPKPGTHTVPSCSDWSPPGRRSWDGTTL